MQPNTEIKTIPDLYNDLYNLLPMNQVQDLILEVKLNILSNMQNTQRPLTEVVTSFLKAISKQKKRHPKESDHDTHAYKLIAKNSLIIAYQSLKSQQN